MSWITYPFPNFNWACDYSSMLGLKLIHVSQRGPRWRYSNWLLRFDEITRHSLEWCHMDPTASQITHDRLFVKQMVQAYNKRNVKAPHYWSFVGENNHFPLYSPHERSIMRKTSPCHYVTMSNGKDTVYPKKYAHSFVVLCFVVVMQSFIMNSHEVFIHIHQGCFAGTGAIVRLPQCQWSKPDGYGKISQCITTTKHSKAKTVCIFLGIYCKPMGRW